MNMEHTGPKLKGSFGIFDYVILIGTLLISVVIGLYYAFIKKQKTNNDLLVGGRKMAIVPSSLSLLASYMSAILILGYTGEIYSSGTLIAEISLGCFLFIPLGGFLFLPTLYGLKLTSVFQYLQMRYESVVVRLLATTTFLIQMTMYMGVILFAPALALEAMVDFPIEYAMAGVGLCAAFYTAIGGLKAVVWTDVFQMLMLISGLLAIVIEGSMRVGGLSNAFAIASEYGRIKYFNFDLNPFVRHTSYGLFFGQGINWMSSYGCHQMAVQRYCSMSSLKRAFLVLFLTTPLVVLTICLGSLCGVIIFATYAGCDPLSLGMIARSDQIAPHFVLENLSSVPGFVGLFMATLFSGALSSLSSGINSMAAVFVEDVLKLHPGFNSMTDVKQGVVTKITGLFFGAIIIMMAFVVRSLGGVLQATIVVNGSVVGPLLALFALGILVPFINKHGAIIGMLTGHALTLWISVGSLVFLDKEIHTLPLSTEKCQDDIWTNVNRTATLEKQRVWALPAPTYDWPDKIFSVSYLFYPLIGGTITVVVATVVSLLTGPMKMTKSREPYIHPLIVLIRKKMRGDAYLSEKAAHQTESNLHIAMNSITDKSLMHRVDCRDPYAHENGGFQT